MITRLITIFSLTFTYAASANSIVEMDVAGKFICKNAEAINYLDTDPISAESVATDSFEKSFTIIGKTIFTRYPAEGGYAAINDKFRGVWKHGNGGNYKFEVLDSEGLPLDAIHLEKSSSLVTPYTISTIRYIYKEGILLRVYIYECVKA